MGLSGPPLRTNVPGQCVIVTDVMLMDVSENLWLHNLHIRHHSSARSNTSSVIDCLGDCSLWMTDVPIQGDGSRDPLFGGLYIYGGQVYAQGASFKKIFQRNWIHQIGSKAWPLSQWADCARCPSLYWDLIWLLRIEIMQVNIAENVRVFSCPADANLRCTVSLVRACWIVRQHQAWLTEETAPKPVWRPHEGSQKDLTTVYPHHWQLLPPKSDLLHIVHLCDRGLHLCFTTRHQQSHHFPRFTRRTFFAWGSASQYKS